MKNVAFIASCQNSTIYPIFIEKIKAEVTHKVLSLFNYRLSDSSNSGFRSRDYSFSYELIPIWF